MTTLSQRLRLKRHTIADLFDVADLTDNWNRLDAYPGVYVCDSTSMPTWEPDQAGLLLWQQDKQVMLSWSGTAFAQRYGRGLLDTNIRTTDLVTTSTVFVVAAQASVPALAHGRSLLVVVDAPRVTNTAGIAGCAIYEGSNPLIDWPSGLPASAGQRAAPYSFIVPPPAAGTILYSFRVRSDPSYGGTTTVVAHCSISVIEV